MTEQSVEIAAQRVLRAREQERIRRNTAREMLRRNRPDLFAQTRRTSAYTNAPNHFQRLLLVCHPSPLWTP